MQQQKIVSLKQIVREHLRDSRWQLCISILCMLAFTVTELISPWPLKIIFDHVLLGKSLPANLGWLYPIINQGKIFATIVLSSSIVVIAIFRGGFAYTQTYITSRIGYEMVYRLRRGLFSHLQRLSLSFHSRSRTGELLTRVVNDTNALRDVFVESALNFATHTVTVIGIFIIMFAINWLLGLVTLATFPILVYSLLFRYRRIKTSARKQREREGIVASRIHEVISELKLVRAFAREKHEQERFERESGHTLQEGIRTARMEAAATRTTEIVSALSMCAVVLCGALQVLSGKILPGEVLVFTAYLTSMYKPLRTMARISSQFSKAMASSERIDEILSIEPETLDDDHGIKVHNLRGEIVFDHVSFDYGDGNGILKNVSLHIRPGERIALVGASGAGKSTIASLLLRFYQAKKGRILIDGIDIDEYQPESLRRQIGVVLQESVLFGASVRENIAYGKPDASDSEIENAAREAAAHEFIEALPEGYDTIIGERGSTLSGGQRQRICLARAILKHPSILILDEPTSAVEAESSSLIYHSINRIQQGKTLIVISHQFEGIQDFDQIYVLRNGEIVEQGTHQQLIETGDYYNKLFFSDKTLLNI